MAPIVRLLLLLLVPLVVIVWRRQRARRAGELAWRRAHPAAADGVIPGAASIALEGGSRAAMLLHGFGDTPQSLSTQARALHEQGWTVRVPLLPGHGRTLEAFQASIAAEWIAASREAYASLRATHEHVSIVGLSMGGALAVLLAVEVPPRALVLLAPYLELSTSGRFWTTVWPIWSIWRAWIPGDAAASIHDPAARAESLGYGSASPWSLRQLRDVADAAATASSRLQAATLVIHSVTDYRIAEATARTSFARLGTTTKQLRWVEKSGHVITVDYDAALVTGAILEWLEQHA